MIKHNLLENKDFQTVLKVYIKAQRHYNELTIEERQLLQKCEEIMNTILPYY